MAMPPSLNLHSCFTTGSPAVQGQNEDKDTYSVGKSYFRSF